MPSRFEDLDISQKTAVLQQGRSVLVLAGPGTGKTEVLTHRVARLLLGDDVQSQHILAVTFTRKAAQEMRERLRSLLGSNHALPNVGTLHAYAKRVLHQFGAVVSFVLDSDEVRTLVGDACEDLGIQLHARERRAVGRWIELQKYLNLEPNAIQAYDSETQQNIRIYSRYLELLGFNKACDLPDLTMKAQRLLSSRRSEDIGIRHLLVDEFQDLAPVEHELVSRLARDTECFFAVGDDDQSIYTWRGADPTALVDFSNHYPDARTLSLERTWRCPTHFLQAALRIVMGCTSRCRKSCVSGSSVNSRVQILRSRSDQSEARWIAEWTNSHIDEGLSDIAVLVPTPKLATLLADELVAQGIPVSHWAQGGWFSKDEVQDILAVMRLLANDGDNLAFRRCLGTGIGGGMGIEFIRSLRRLAETQGSSLWHILENAASFPELRRWSGPVATFARNVAELHREIQGLSPDAMIRHVATKLNLQKRVAIDQFIRYGQSLPVDFPVSQVLSELIESKGIVKEEAGAEKDESREAVNFLTIHGAKGLTFGTVFILGMDAKRFPSPGIDLDEQRRLCYVAMTRAKKNLFLCHARRRTGLEAPGVTLTDIPSRFIREIMSASVPSNPDFELIEN